MEKDSGTGRTRSRAWEPFAGPAVIVTDVEGRIVAWDYGAERIYGWAREEVVGRSVLDVLVPEEGGAHAAEIMAALAEPSSDGWDGRVRLRCKGGEVIEVLAQDTPIVVDGKVVAILGQSASVSQLRSLDSDLAALAPGAGVAAVVEARQRWMESFYDEARSVMSVPELEAVLRDVLATVCNSLDADAASLLVTDDDDRVLVARAAFGWDAERFRPVRIPAGAGVSGKILATGEGVVVDDLDDVEVASPELRRSGFHSYVGVPLIQRGRPVGVLHATSRQRRRFGAGDLATLHTVAGPLAAAVDRVRHFVGLADLANPTKVHRLVDLEVHAASRSSDGASAGGDWYDTIQRQDGSSAIVIGDAGGHGVEALISAGAARHALIAYLHEGHAPAESLSRLQTLMAAASFGAQADLVTILACVYEPASRTLHVASAGHPPLLRLTSENSQFGPAADPPISAALPPTTYTAHTLPLEPGEVVVLYTDGLIEVRGESLDLGLDRLRAAAVAHRHLPLAELSDRLFDLTDAAEPGDDRSLVVLRVR